jgi:hypothetical protein
MFTTLLTNSPWPGIVLALAFTLLDLALTIRERALYYVGAQELIAIQGQYRLDRPYQAGAGWRQFWTRRYTLLLAGTAAGVGAGWYIFTRMNNLPEVYLFTVGGLVLFEFVENVRLVRFINLYRYALRKSGLRGHLEVQSWVTNNLFVIDQYAFALIFLLAFLASGEWFFLGGTASCFVFGHQLRDFVVSRRLRKV